jgi:hypothetical protein
MAENIEKLILDDSGFINPLKESIKVMEEAEKAFKDLNNAQSQGGQKAANEIKKASEVQQKAIQDVAKAAKVSIMTQEEHGRKITETAAAMLKSGDTAKKFAELLKKVETVKLSGAKSDIQDLEKEFTGLLKTVKLTDDQMDFLSQNIDEVAKEIASLDAKELENIANKAGQMTDKFVTAKSELRQLTNLINSGQLTGDELIMAKNRAGQLTDEIGDTRDEIKRLASDTRGLDLLGDSMQTLGATMQIAEGSMALFGDESQEMQKALIRLNAVMAISNGLGQLGEQITKKGTLANRIAAGVQSLYTAAIGSSTGAMKLFKIALIGTGIGALVIVLSALVANWDKVKKSVNDNAQAMFDWGKKVTFIMPPLNLLIKGVEWLYNNFTRLDNIAKGAIDGVVAGLGAVGEVVSKLFSGDFSGAYAAAKQVGAKIGKATNEGIAEADKDDANNAQAKAIDNIVKSQKKRLEVLEASGKETAKLQKNILQNELKSLQLAGAEKQVIEDKQHEIALFNAERSKIAAEKAAAAKAKADEIEKQRIEKIKEALQELKGLQDEIFEVQKNTGNLSEKEIFDFVKIKQIEQIELLITKLKEVAAVTGRDVTPEIKKLDDAIRTISFEGFEIKGVEKIGSTLERYIAKYTNQIPAIKVSVPVEPKPEAEINNFDDLLDKILTDILGDIDGGKAKEFLIGASTLVGEFGNILNEATDIQLSNIDKQLDKLSERRETLQDELSRELELQEKGLANNVGNKQAEVDALLSEEDRLLKQRDQIQKEAQKRQLISDTITQTQGLITSAINIYKGFSVLGPFGIPLAIAAIASMFAFFAKTKAEAFKATKLYSGAERISDHFGYGERHGDTDLPGRGSGYRLINERTGKPTNVIISGKEMLLPESVSLPNSEFFHSLRNGVYNGVDLNAAMGFYLNYKGKVHRATQNTVIVAQNTPQSKQKARVAIPHTMKNGRKGVIITTIKDDWTDGKFIEFDL